MISASWIDRWEQIVPFLESPPDLRRIVYTTNTIEALNRQPRKHVKTRGSFPTEDSARKLLYLAITAAQQNWRRAYNWNAALAALKIHFGDRRVVDLGCGAGALLERLLRDDYEFVFGVDVSARALEQAARRLKLDELHESQRQRIELAQAALTYRDQRLAGFAAAALVEVIEHLDPPRLAAAEQNVFGSARPATVVVTTPNAEYNVRWETLAPDTFRHTDHRFEWARAEFTEWTERVAARYGYTATHHPVGTEDPEVGSPTQMAVFSR